MDSKTAVENNYNPAGTGPHTWAGTKKQLADAAENQKRIGRYNYNVSVTEISLEEIELHTEARQFNVTLPSCPYGLNYIVEDGKLIAGSPEECFAAVNALEASLGWYYKSTKKSKSGKTKGRRKKEKLDVSDARKWRAVARAVEKAGRKDLLPKLKALKALPAQLKLARAAGIFPKMPRPTPLQKIEANLSPVEMGFFRKLLEGKDGELSPAESEKRILEFLPKLMAHLVALVRMRTGLDVVGCSIHLNSGKWHFVIWTSRVTKAHELCGDKLGKNNRHQMGRYGHWTSAIKSQVDAGYELPARVVDKWEQNKAEMARRYPQWSGLAIDPWLEEAARVFLAAHFIDGDVARRELWRDSQEEYCRWLRKVEPIKARREQEIKNAGLGKELKKQKVSLGEAARHGRAEIVRVGLTEVMGKEEVANLDSSDFPVLRIADLVARGKLALLELLEAAKAGWEKLVAWLKTLVTGGSPDIPVPDEGKEKNISAPPLSRRHDKTSRNPFQKGLAPVVSSLRPEVEEPDEIMAEDLWRKSDAINAEQYEVAGPPDASHSPNPQASPPPERANRNDRVAREDQQAAGSMPVHVAVAKKTPSVRPLSITDAEGVSLREVKTAMATYPDAPIGGEFKLVIANWERGVWGGSGLSQDQLKALAEQRHCLRTWVAAQEQSRLTAVPEASLPTPILPRTEVPGTGGIEATRGHESGGASLDVAKPENQREKAMYDQVRAWLGHRWDHPASGREQAIAERCWYVTRSWANGDLEQVRQEPASPGSKGLRSTATRSVTVTGEKNVRELMETAPFPRFNSVVDQVVKGKTLAQAISAVKGEPEIPR